MHKTELANYEMMVLTSSISAEKIILPDLYPRWQPNLWRIILICYMTDSPSKKTDTICMESQEKMRQLILSFVDDGGLEIFCGLAFC
jgi:hypothetical protein